MLRLPQSISASPQTKCGHIDNLMQDTWLLALAIRNNSPVTVDDALYRRCFDMIGQVQDKLIAAKIPEHIADEIKFAHSVFLDEAIMTQPDTDVSVWWIHSPLQSHFLGHINGGDHFYENIKKLLREPAPAEALILCYYRMLQFGYAGKYQSENNSERLSLMQQLEKLLPEMPVPENQHAIVVSAGNNEAMWWRSPQMILISLLLLTAGLWMSLRLFLLAQ